MKKKMVLFVILTLLLSATDEVQAHGRYKHSRPAHDYYYAPPPPVYCPPPARVCPPPAYRRVWVPGQWRVGYRSRVWVPGYWSRVRC